MSDDFLLRPMRYGEWPTVAELIHTSTNAWYQANRRISIFTGPASDAMLFCEVYEDLDPGCCIVAEHKPTRTLAGSCFYHPRPTHVSLGIMNSHPRFAATGVARLLLNHIIDLAQNQRLPLRLVSSAMNLDSFSLYTRAGFVPRLLFQDMFLHPAQARLPDDLPTLDRVRPATAADAPAMAVLECELAGIDRAKDFHYFIRNARSIWHTIVCESPNGAGLDGFLVSVGHPASHMLGPGVMRDEATAAALILAQLRQRLTEQPVWLVPCECVGLVRMLYEWGARNCEMHVAQALGPWQAPRGVVMPTFMPETG